MKKFLYFATAAADDTASGEEVVLFPAERLVHFEMATSTQLRCYFDAAQEIEADAVNRTVVVLTVTSGKHKEVLEAVSGAIAAAAAINNPMVTIADSENGVFVHPNLTACASIDVIDAS
tara:strand:- start:41 stop:397 length:357 start_codon:yes stop_codon:yes gene_type:complete